MIILRRLVFSPPYFPWSVIIQETKRMTVSQDLELSTFLPLLVNIIVLHDLKHHLGSVSIDTSELTSLFRLLILLVPPPLSLPSPSSSYLLFLEI